MQKREIDSASYARAQLLIPEDSQRPSTGGLLDAEFDSWPAAACTCAPTQGFEALICWALGAEARPWR